MKIPRAGPEPGPPMTPDKKTIKPRIFGSKVIREFGMGEPKMKVRKSQNLNGKAIGEIRKGKEIDEGKNEGKGGGGGGGRSAAETWRGGGIVLCNKGRGNVGGESGKFAGEQKEK